MNEHVHPVFASILNRQLGRNLGPLSAGLIAWIIPQGGTRDEN